MPWTAKRDGQQAVELSGNGKMTHWFLWHGAKRIYGTEKRDPYLSQSSTL
jgi:hypothetical protein